MTVSYGELRHTYMAKQRVPRTRAGEQWTEARYWQFIRSALRQAFSKYPAKFAAKVAARRTVTGKRHRYEYQCNHCEHWFKDKEVQVDHIIPAGSLRCYDDLAGFVERLFCEPRDLQVLCKPCHAIKTKEERNR